MADLDVGRFEHFSAADAAVLLIIFLERLSGFLKSRAFPTGTAVRKDHPRAALNLKALDMKILWVLSLAKAACPMPLIGLLVVDQFSPEVPMLIGAVLHHLQLHFRQRPRLPGSPLPRT